MTMRPSIIHLVGLALVALFAWLSLPASAAAERLELHHLPLDLPAAPAVILPVDLDGDGRLDLVTALVYTLWDQRTVEETTEMDDVEGLVEVLTIVPSLDERREVRAWLAEPSSPSGYRAVQHALELPPTVHALEAGPPGLPVVALTDDGLSRLVLDRTPGTADELRLEPVVRDPTVLAGTGTLFPDLGLVRDVDGDGVGDVLLPARDGLALYRGTPEGLATEATSRLALPTDEFDTAGGERVRRFPLPEIRDVSGDGLPDLLLPDREEGWASFWILENLGAGRFADPRRVAAPPACKDDEEGEEGEEERGREQPCRSGRVAHFGDLDGDGLAEWIFRRELFDPDAGMRQEIREAKNPPYRYFLHHSRADLTPRSEPYQSFEAVGYTFAPPGDADSDAEVSFRFPGMLNDLEGDGDLDLVTVTLDFSMLQVMRVMTTRTFGMGLDFHIFCQGDDGAFAPVTGTDLSGKFRVHLDDLRFSHLSVFEGDFDADGRPDFVQLGRGRDVTIHRGRDGCRYPSEPDLEIRLEEEPADMALVRIEDYDGDGRSDLLLIQPRAAPEEGVTRPVRLDLYLSGGER